LYNNISIIIEDNWEKPQEVLQYFKILEAF